MAIAVADIAAQQPMAMEMTVAQPQAPVEDSRDAEIRELRRQNGTMFQLLLAQGYKE
jgi:hypothetical protein